ncbi:MULTISPECIES: hypothetical protein [Clostridium]|uniref:hypothetical protein n=1 Tax=Clostridium TaxID=1485 RepID=UPI000DF98768|nr:hypothetical protein [Clostridium sporogenes]MCW6085539.1 hypothetical protein [Clostridium sporogenes]STC84076.1 Uncharacterised protein [Clostridium botulinum]
METYLSKVEYKWVKSRAKIEDVECVDSFKDLLSPEFYANGEYVFVRDEKQLYKCKHAEKLIKQ